MLKTNIWVSKFLLSAAAVICVSRIVAAQATSFSPKGIAMSSAAPARPGHFAELEELDAARRLGTLEAYDLFLARHPTSRYAPKARKERDFLAKKIGKKL